nr:Asp-tRNA(Asn)/Glu-tRNA(Gln) amidotransferase GatCAB subunit B [Gordonia sp. (in: high G+C Gram-positive bacteria)]
QQANARGTELADLPINPAQVATIIGLVDEGKLTTKLGQQVAVAVLDGEGEPAQIVADRGLEVVRDDSALQKAVDEALAANPDIVEKIKGGKVKAAGKIVGDVMKATRGQADAARVQELVLDAVNNA